MNEDLIAFLLARLDEDEAVARAAAESAPDLSPSDPVEFVLSGNVLSTPYTEAADAHIRRHAPARALREVEAKRRMLRHYEHAAISLANAGPAGEVRDLMTGAVNTLRAVLRDHARVYDDHPDYREEWKP